MYRNKRIPRSNFILLEQKNKVFETVCVVIFFVIAKLVPPFSTFLSPQYINLVFQWYSLLWKRHRRARLIWDMWWEKWTYCILQTASFWSDLQKTQRGVGFFIQKNNHIFMKTQAFLSRASTAPMWRRCSHTLSSFVNHSFVCCVFSCRRNALSGKIFCSDPSI